MKLLCPTDFSNASVNACRWAALLLQSVGGGELELLHCINVVSRSVIFLKTEDVFREHAENDLRDLSDKIHVLVPCVKIKCTIVKSDPKSFLVDYTKDKDYDFIVMGTKGMTSLKEMTIGSVTAYLMDRVSTPLLAIPEDRRYKTLQTIVLGIDGKEMEASIYEPLVGLAKSCKTRIEVIHLSKEENLPIDYRPAVDIPLEGVPYHLTTLPAGRSIPHTLTQHSVSVEADLLVMSHKQRNWLERLFVNSLSRRELFVIETPLLILPDAT